MKRSFLTLAAIIPCVFLLIATGPLMAQTDALFIDANGRVGLSASGQAIADSIYTLVLSIWDDSTGGNILWSETHLVQTKDGLWNATLGSLTPLPIDVVAPGTSDSLEARYLQMEFDGESIQPRRRMGGLPYAGAAGRMRGDINTGPGSIQVKAGDAPESDYEFNIKNSNDSGTVVEVKKPKGKGSNPSMDGVVILYSSLPSGQALEMDLLDNDSGVSISYSVGPDSTGEIQGRLEFEETVLTAPETKSKKPKEIVVVGSKVTEKTSHFHNIQNNVSDYEFVKGHSSGKRTYSPLMITSAVLPDTIPGYSLDVDSGGTVMMMAKNNSDGSSCWIRTSQLPTGGSWELNSADALSSTQGTQNATPKLYEAACKGTHLSGDTSEISEFVSVDSGYGQTVRVTDGSNTMQTSSDVDGRDYLIWQRGGSSASGDSVSKFELLSIDSGYNHSLKLSNGTSTTESVDAADYVLWRKSYGSYNTSGDTVKFATALSADSGYIEEIDVSSGGTSTKKVNKIDAFVIKQSVKASSTASGASEIVMEIDPDMPSLRLSNETEDRHQSQYVDDTSSTFEMYENVIARAKVEKIVMKHTPLAGSRLYVGNLGFSTSDGFRVNADLAGGTKVGINVGTPTSTLDVNGTLEIGNGTPISQVLSATATLDFPSTSGGGATSDLSISVPGAVLGDVVSLGIPGGSVTAQGIFTGWVSVTNVVTVRFANLASATQNPASGTFRAMVTKF